MKGLATAVVLSIVLTLPAGAAVVHNEGVNGDLSSDAANPTALVLAPGGNSIIGSCGNVGTPADVRDYITFTIPAGRVLIALNLNAFAPANLAFASFNSGSTSFIPSGATDAQFLSGIHVLGTDLGSDILPRFVDRAVTTNSLPAAQLTAGTYCFLIQQTSPLLTTYELEFVLDGSVSDDGSTWGAVKRLYR